MVSAAHLCIGPRVGHRARNPDVMVGAVTSVITHGSPGNPVFDSFIRIKEVRHATAYVSRGLIRHTLVFRVSARIQLYGNGLCERDIFWHSGRCVPADK